jgi:energy-coupling factor transporter ATP-binding protein EcfA2
MNTDTDMENLFAPVGWDKELKEFQTILDQKKPVLIIVTGNQGMGKSTFLQMTAKVAEHQNWNLLEFSIGLDTTRKDFEQKLKSEFKGNESGISPALGQNQSAAEKERDNKLSQPIVQELKYQCPVVLQIDGYQPGSQFELWFTSEFIPGIKNSGASIIVVVADHPSAIDRLIELSNHKIQLKGINKRKVKEQIKSLNTDYKLSLNSAEEKIYLDAIAEKPFLFNPLKRILLLQTPM